MRGTGAQFATANLVTGRRIPSNEVLDIKCLEYGLRIGFEPSQSALLGVGVCDRNLSGEINVAIPGGGKSPEASVEGIFVRDCCLGLGAGLGMFREFDRQFAGSRSVSMRANEKITVGCRRM